MKTLILIITLAQADVWFGPDGTPPIKKEIVASPQAAAVRFWTEKQSEPMFGEYTAELWELTLPEGTVKKLNIPSINFVEK